MNFTVLNPRNASQKDFVEFWSRFYSGYDENFYKTNLGQELTPTRIHEWFVWKNGRRLSEKKARSLLENFHPRDRIDVGADISTVQEFLLKDGGPIWRIFWLHIQHPTRFPIYDQHVHRAMAILEKRSEVEIPENESEKIATYLREYLPFFANFETHGRREVDRALWTFGQFSKAYGRILI